MQKCLSTFFFVVFVSEVLFPIIFSHRDLKKNKKYSFKSYKPWTKTIQLQGQPQHHKLLFETNKQKNYI